MDDLSLTVEAGDIYGFIGHNGAGKTTTIRAVVGVLDFEEGAIAIDGHSIKEEPVVCKSITAYIPDNPDLYDHLTGIQYLQFIGDVFRVDPRDRQARLEDYAARFEITGNLGDLVSSYSHGMKQKVAILGALLHAPKLLVLDEPFVGLDPKASHTLKVIMHESARRAAPSFSPPNVLDVAEKLCNKIAIIKGGRLIASGPIEDVRGSQSLEDVFLELTDN